MTQPACMTDREYALWSEANDAMNKPAPTPCFDCPLAFSRAMRSDGCCDGSPGPKAGRRRLTDSPQRRQWRDSARRFRASRAREVVAR